MKYYAVTEDPNELLHYGVKGMKWGQHIFGDKPKSAGFHRALGKLRTAANKAKTAVRNSAVQAAANRKNRQQEKYNRAVQKTQKRINEIEGLNSLNRLQDFEKAANRQQKAEQKQARYDAKMQKYAIKSQNIADKFSMKQQRKFTKNERKMDKYMQEAREGRLKYGKLSDEQVHKITDRLAIERNARALGSTEKPKFRTRMKEAIQEGMLKGTAQGIAAGMTEVAVAKVQNRMRNKAILDKQAKQKASREHEANRIRNKKSHKEMREDIKNEAYEAQVRAGTNMWNRNQWLSTAGAAKALQEANNKMHESQRKLAIDDKIKNELQFENDKDYQKMLSDKHERERAQGLIDEAKDERDRSYYKLIESGDYDPGDAKDLKQRYRAEFGKEQTKKVFGKVKTRKFNKLSEDEKRNVILSIEKSVNEGKSEDTIKQYNKIMDIREKNRQIDQANSNLLKGYTDRLNAWYGKGQQGPKPKTPQLIPRIKEPEITFKLYDQVSSMHLPSLYGKNSNGGQGGSQGGGQGGKGRKKNQGNN